MRTSFLILLVGLLAARVAAEPVTPGLPAPRLVPAVTPPAQPVSLHQVRLLDGPFKDAQDLAARYLLSLEPDRLLSAFRSEAGLAPRAARYGGWEMRGVAGHSLGHYLSGCALAWAATGDPALRDRVNYIVDELAACQDAQGDGYVAGIPGGKQAYQEVARGNIRSAGFDLNGIWVPNYTMHKLFAGLRDAYRLAGNTRALVVERALADWFYPVFAGLTDAQMQKVLDAEHGGLNETFADLYADTGETRYLELSRMFHHKAILDPLAEGRDILPGKHANTQIPKLVGLATRYELTGDPADQAAAEFFWDRVVNHHSYVTGGHCDAEHFGQPDKLNDRLSPVTTETCNVYNMLKLTRHLFGWDPRAGVADFYERAFLNHMRATQHPADGRVIYNLSLQPGHYKEYQSQYDGFTCCVGTGMENHLKYGEFIYYQGPDDLWVNLFIASRLDWQAKGLTLVQQTDWPLSDHTVITVQGDQPVAFTLNLRHPHWAHALEVRVNGEPVPVTSAPSSYCRIARTWSPGDRVEIRFPMTLRTESMPDNPDRIAVFFGPTLLAADLGPVDDPAAREAGYVPVLVTKGEPVDAWVRPVNVATAAFRTDGVGRPRDVPLVPFYGLHDRRYTVYLDRYTPEQWEQRKAEILAEEQRRQDIAARTMDQFQPGEMQPERDHNVKGENSDPVEALGRKLRHAVNGGWFSYEMKVDPEQANELVCTWWGSEVGQRSFDILVDDTRIATQTLLRNQPDQFWDATYPIPVELTRGKDRVTVKLQAHPDNFAGGLFGSRILRAP